MLKIFLTILLSTTALGIEYDLSGVNWNAINYNDLPFFVLWGSGPVANERIDPIMNPGQTLSQHLHEFTGANVVSPGMTQADLQQGTCSTFQAKADKSSYWNSALYFQNPKTGSFTQVPGKAGNNRKVYYSYKTATGTLQPGMSAFPQGFKMLTGDSQARTEDAVQACPSAECGYHQMGGKVVGWICQGAGDGVAHVGFPKGITSCPGGLRGQVMFPDCWNGKEFNPAAPNDHVAFSTGDGGVAGCPSTHQVARLPQIYVEVNYDIDQFNGQYTAEDSPFVLATGDKTGFGFHMDFMNGWQEGTLATVMKTCRKGDGSNPQTLAEDSCFGQVGGMYTEQEVNACKIQQPIGPQQALKTVDALPGCQTITHVGVIADLKTCRDTTATLESGPVAGRSTPGYDAVSSPSRIIVKRPAVPPIPTMQLAKKRFVAGHGRSIEVNRGEFAF